MRLILTLAVSVLALAVAPSALATTSSAPATTANPGSVDSGGAPGSPMDGSPQLLEGEEPGVVAGSDGPADPDALMLEPKHPGTPDTSSCGGHGDLVGKTVGSFDLNAIKAERAVRVLKPGDAATMDYSEQRLNIITDNAGLILEVRCG